MVDELVEPDRGGGRFFDNRKRYRGSAVTIIAREPNFSNLTVLEVVGADQHLAEFLALLDRSRLQVQHPRTGNTLFTFRWASGYENGKGIRVQGVLDHA